MALGQGVGKPGGEWTSRSRVGRSPGWEVAGSIPGSPTGSIPGSPGSFRGHFFVKFGMSWDVSGSGQGTFLDGFWMVLEKMSDEVGKCQISKMFGSMFPESGRSRIAFLAYPRPKISNF